MATGRLLAPVAWHREVGKTPSFFDEKHLEVLAMLPEFGDKE